MNSYHKEGNDKFRERCEKALSWPKPDDWVLEKSLKIMKECVRDQRKAARDLEAAICRHFHCAHAVSYTNCTSAIHASLFALKVPPGSEVLVPSLTYWASVVPMLWHGLVPVFCDVEPDTLCISPQDAIGKITPKTRGLIAVHLFGQMADMDRIQAIAKENGLFLLEDASQAFGAKYKSRMAGMIGDIGVFSFQASKHISAGEGGVLITDEHSLFERASCLGHYRRTGELEDVSLRMLSRTGLGFKFDIHPIAAELARDQLAKNDELNMGIYRDIETLETTLKKHPFISIPGTAPSAKRVYWTRFHVHYDPDKNNDTQIKTIRERLDSLGLITFEEPTPYARGLHREPLFTDPSFLECYSGHAAKALSTVQKRTDRLPVTEALSGSNVLTFPVFPSGDRSLMEEYAERLERAFAQEE